MISGRFGPGPTRGIEGGGGRGGGWISAPPPSSLSSAHSHGQKNGEEWKIGRLVDCGLFGTHAAWSAAQRNRKEGEERGEERGGGGGGKSE